MPGRDTTFDIMKGIGIILVITCHFFGWNHLFMSRVINSFHMPMFFIVAGYFSKSHIDINTDRTNVKKYISRLLPAFLFTQILIVCWGVLMVYWGKGSWDSVVVDALSTIWADPFGPQFSGGRLSIGVIWFLLALLTAKIMLIPLSRAGKWAIPISLLIAYLAILLHRAFPYSIFCLTHAFTALPFVTIGWWVKNYGAPTWLKVVAVAAWCVSLRISHLGMYDVDWGCFPLDIVAACGGTYCLYFLSRIICKYIRPIGIMFAMLGIWSLAIMCAHCFEMASHLGNHVMGLTPFGYPIWAKYLIRYIVTVLLSIAFYYLPVTKKIFA